MKPAPILDEVIGDVIVALKQIRDSSPSKGNDWHCRYCNRFVDGSDYRNKITKPLGHLSPFSKEEEEIWPDLIPVCVIADRALKILGEW